LQFFDAVLPMAFWLIFIWFFIFHTEKLSFFLVAIYMIIILSINYESRFLPIKKVISSSCSPLYWGKFSFTSKPLVSIHWWEYLRFANLFWFQMAKHKNGMCLFYFLQKVIYFSITFQSHRKWLCILKW
jgi:hypothetical protein